MGKFNLKDLMSERSAAELKKVEERQEIVYKNPEELIPSEDNFYKVEKLGSLKQSLLLVGVLQPFLIEKTDAGDVIIAGHRRCRACLELIREGHEEFRSVPCVYKTRTTTEKEFSDKDDILRRIALIQANNYRDKSDWERMMEVLQMEELVKELRKSVELEGKSRSIASDIIGVSETQIGRYSAINSKLNKILMEKFKSGEINVSVAYEASGLDEERQQLACDILEKTGNLTTGDLQALKASVNTDIPGQVTVAGMLAESIPYELQIDRFYESMYKNLKVRIHDRDKPMTIYLMDSYFSFAKQKTKYLNYQGSHEGITFNPEIEGENFFTWQQLAEILIEKYGKKVKPVKFAPLADEEAETPVNTVQSGDSEEAHLSESDAVKAFREACPEEFAEIMRICRKHQNNGDAAKEIQQKIAPYGLYASAGQDVGYVFHGFSYGVEITVKKKKVQMKYGRLVVEAKNLCDPFSEEFDIPKGQETTGKCAHRPEYDCTLTESQKLAPGAGIDCHERCCWECPQHGLCGLECNSSAHRPEEPETLRNTDENEVFDACITGKSQTGKCGAAAYCDSAEICCAYCDDDSCNARCGWLEKDAAKTQQNPEICCENAAEFDSWPNILEDIPVPSLEEIEDLLEKEERDLKEYLTVEELPHKALLKKQMSVAGLRLIRNIVQKCQEEGGKEQPDLPDMRNNDQRKEWLRSYKKWGIWYKDEHTGARYYKYDFENGARIIAEEYVIHGGGHIPDRETYYLHLVGGPEPKRNNGIPKWAYHKEYEKYPESESELIEFLKEVQRK